jgi:putative ATP-dependent endonuclease of OLD family
LDDASNAIHTAWSFQNFASPASSTAGTPEQLAWLRELVPALWLRQGWITSPADPASSPSFTRNTSLDELLIRIERHHRNLLSGESPDLVAELEQGALAARDLLERTEGVFTGAGPLMSAMASEILNRRDAPASKHALGANAANKIAMLVLLGALIQLLRRRTLPQSKPVLVIENPEANLHPMTLAAVWRIIERILWQKVITTNSGTILSSAPITSLRRLTRSQGTVTEWSVSPRALSKDNLRRVAYHLRSRRASAMFARSWLLVEGETEFWALPELARICGYDFSAEGVVCVEFAQCGLAPLTKLADQLGIAWLVLVDGDDAGRRYAEAALHLKRSGSSTSRSVIQIRERDIEHCFWNSGFAPTIQAIAYPHAAPRPSSPASVIRKAIERTSKPFLALSLLDAAAARGPRSVPPILRSAIDASVALARSSPLRTTPR